MVHDFSRIPSANIPRSSFNLSQAYKTTFDAGWLIPFFLQEVVPGDTHSVTCQSLVRLATPLKPFMDNVTIETFFFFVPNRLVWDNWTRFMGEQDNPGDSTDFVIPHRDIGVADGSLSDYFGLPLGTVNEVSDLPYRAYHLIFNEWFRSQDLQASAPHNTGDAPLDGALYNLLRRGKRHDYFTSCLPWPQKGPGVDLPLGETAPIFSDAQANGLDVVGISRTGTANVPTALHHADFPGGVTLTNTPDPIDYELLVDLSDATAATINDLRQAFAIQKLQERDARGGTRYQELVLSHFGVRGGDARLQRPEYLGGSSAPLGIVQIPQTAPDPVGGTDTPQGNLAAYGVSQARGGFTKSFTEHGYIMGLVNARADLTYQKGVDRHWNRSTKYDFYWPALSKIGEQAVLNKEIYNQGNATDDQVFGYQERWAEMRHNNSKLTGLFRSDAAASLDYWHLSQDFANLPALNDTFIQDDPPIDRVIAVPSEPHFLLDAYFKHKAARPMPINSAPGYIDHF